MWKEKDAIEKWAGEHLSRYHYTENEVTTDLTIILQNILFYLKYA